jgi:hypothetical protein
MIGLIVPTGTSIVRVLLIGSLIFRDSAREWAISWSLLPGWYGDGLGLMLLGMDGVLALDEWELVTDSR